MSFFKKIWIFSYKVGISLFLLTIMFLSSVILVSISQKGKITYGNRCNSYFDTQIISYLNQEEVISYDYTFSCNTLYLDLNLDETIKIETAKTLLIRIAAFYNEINYNVNTQLTIKGKDYLILASLVDKEVTMSITNL